MCEVGVAREEESNSRKMGTTVIEEQFKKRKNNFLIKKVRLEIEMKWKIEKQ